MFCSVEDAFAQVHAGLDVLLDIDPSTLSGEEVATLAVLAHQLQNRCDALATRSVGVFDRYGDPDGAQSTAAWVAWRCRIRRSKARAELSRARVLRHMPAVAAAYDTGQISSDHVQVLAAARRAAEDEVFAACESELVRCAVELRFDPFARHVAYFRQHADRERAERDAGDAHARRGMYASRSLEDMVYLNGTLDPVGGAVYLNELGRLERELFDADWRDARQQAGDAATVADLRRTPEQRRADAQVLMAERSAARPEDARPARPLITVLVGYETFHGMMSQLADGTVLTPGQILPLLPDADIERVVFDGPSRVLDVGARQRLFNGATRRAVEIRDRFCTHPSCDIPYERCDVDHIDRWEHGGPTIQANGRVRCPHHNPGRRRPRTPEPPHPPPPNDEP